eukprot:TRINITY_DN22886_c0_g1_i3.p2 TRINITY_DN22886_c0_g1~~TRINITY_DN22886_c0_g1_i3.p2  ORF type:complete len:444 (+),score=171.95 TRINITY_DN22886_c0_g1_i3:198-1529(+)
MAAQHYSFPTLSEQEVIDVFAELQIPLSTQSLTKPPTGFMRDLYERCLAMLTGIRREEITTRNFAATQCLSDPGLHDDTIPEIQFFRELRRLMETVGITDFSRRDVDKPVKERTVRILSAIINFAKFRLDKMDQIEEFEEDLENLLDQRQALVDGNAQAAMAIERCDNEREAVRPQVEELERESFELEGTLKRLNNEQGELQKDSRVLKEETAAVQERVESLKLALLNQRQENEKLSMQVVHSPDKLKAQLDEMERTLEATTDHKNQAETRLRQVHAKSEGLLKLAKEVEKSQGMLEEVAQEMHKAVDVKSEGKTMKTTIADKGEEMKELDAQQQHLQRELQLAQERLQRLNTKKATMKDTAERQLSTAQHEMEMVERERQAAQAQFDEGSQFVTAMKGKTEQMSEQHKSEMAAMQGHLDNLAQELESYHSALFTAIAKSTVA